MQLPAGLWLFGRMFVRMVCHVRYLLLWCCNIDLLVAGDLVLEETGLRSAENHWLQAPLSAA